MITSKLTTTYSFKKLENIIDNVLDDATDIWGETVSNSMKDRIQKGLRPPLSGWTLIKDAAIIEIVL